MAPPRVPNRPSTGRQPRPTPALRLPRVPVGSARPAPAVPQPTVPVATYHDGRLTVAVPVDARTTGLVAHRFGVAADQVPVAAAGDYLRAVRAAGGTNGAAPLASPTDTLTRAWVALRLHPELRAQLADTHGNYAREHAPGLGLGAALCLALGPVVTDVLDWLGFDGDDHAQHFVATTAVVHTATPPLARAAQVITNRLIERQLGGIAVDFVGQAALRGGATAVTVIERGGLLRNIGRAMAFQLLPEGASASARVLGGLRGFGGALRNAWFMPGVTWGRLLDTGLEKVLGEGYATWGGRGALSTMATFAPDVADMASKGGLTRWLAGSATGRVVSRLTSVGAGLAFWDMASWGVMKLRYGDRAERASAGDRAAEIGNEAEQTRPLLRALRWVGLGKDFADTIGAGEMPLLSAVVDGLDDAKVALGLMDPRVSVEAIRDGVAAKRAAQASVTVEEIQGLLRSELLDLGAEVGDLTPSRLVELVEGGWLSDVQLPAALRGYSASAEELYDRVRLLSKLRVDDAQALLVASWFTDEFFGSTAKVPLKPGSPVLQREAAMWEWLGGRDQVRAERRTLLYGVLIEQQLQLAKAGLGLEDLRALARDVRSRSPMRVVEGGMTVHESVAREIDATAQLIEWAQQRGFIGEDGEIRADPEYYTALSRYSAGLRAQGDAAGLEGLRTWAVARGMGLDTDATLSAAERARYVSELMIVGPETLFGEGSLQADLMRTMIHAHGAAVRTEREQREGTCGPTHAPEADTALAEAAKRELQAARAALASGVMARTALPRFTPLANDVRVAMAVTALHDGLAAHGRRDAAATVVRRLSAAATDAELQTAYEEGGAAYAELYGAARGTSRSLAYDKAEAESTLERGVVLDPALSDVPTMLRRAVRADPTLATQYDLDPETGAFTSAAALEAFLAPTLREAQQADEQLFTMTRSIGIVERPERTNLGAPPVDYQTTKAEQIQAFSVPLQKRLTKLVLEAVATGHVEGVDGSAWLEAQLFQDPATARLIQDYVALHRQAHLSEAGERSLLWHAFTSDGRVEDWAAIRAWVGPQVVAAAAQQLAAADTLLQAIPAGHSLRGELALQAIRLQWHVALRTGPDAVTAQLDAVEARIRSVRGPLGAPLTAAVERELATLQEDIRRMREDTAWQAEAARLARALNRPRSAPALGAHAAHWGGRYFAGVPAQSEVPTEHAPPTRCATHH